MEFEALRLRGDRPRRPQSGEATVSGPFRVYSLAELHVALADLA